MEKFVNAQVIEKSSLFLDLSRSVLDKIDRHMEDSELTKLQQEKLMGLMEEVYGEAYVNSMTD